TNGNEQSAPFSVLGLIVEKNVGHPAECREILLPVFQKRQHGDGLAAEMRKERLESWDCDDSLAKHHPGNRWAPSHRKCAERELYPVMCTHVAALAALGNR